MVRGKDGLISAGTSGCRLAKDHRLTGVRTGTFRIREQVGISMFTPEGVDDEERSSH